MTKDPETQIYRQLGVSATKDEVHAAVVAVPEGILPGAFCRVQEDIFHDDPGYCVVSHADGAGTKSILAYLHYARTQDARVFRGIAQDALVMNLDDMLCVGATTGFVVASLVNRNARRVGGEVIAALVEGTQEFAERMTALGVRIRVAGGETADVGDVVRTILVDGVMTCRMARTGLVEYRVQPGDVIVGLASGGPPTHYEDSPNSGIGCNGLTAARHCLLHKGIAETYPEAFDDALDRGLVYRGPYAPDDRLPGSDMTVLQALLSPTRTYAPLIRDVLAHYRSQVSGLIHCTGGGQFKCQRFGSGLRYVKTLPPLPPLFRVLRDQGGIPLKELVRIFNAGIRMEIYCHSAAASGILDLARGYGIGAWVIGQVEQAPSRENEVALTVEGETLGNVGP